MLKLSDYANYVTSQQKSSYGALDGNGKLNAIKKFYKDNDLNLPGQITLTSSTKGIYLSKDQKLKIYKDYFTAMQAGKVTPEMQQNVKAAENTDEVATFSETYAYSEAVKALGPAVVAAKLIDALPVKLNEEFHKIRKFDVPAPVSISEIPAFIEELKKIYEASQKAE